MAEEINEKLSEISNGILNEKKLIHILKKYSFRRKITLCNLVDKRKLKEDESFYRIEVGRFENDYNDPNDETSLFYRKARLTKIK